MIRPHSLFLAVVTSFSLASATALGVPAQLPEDKPDSPAVEPDQAESTFQVDPRLSWKLLLHEPTITQPLMTVHDSRGRMWVVEYRQYPNPAGLKPLSRDKHWRIVYDTMPLPPGKGGVRGNDRISIHEDQDGDGSYESHSVFVDGLNIATAVAPVAGGAWVLNPPYLLFYPDKDDDGRADGDPEIHLSGFGLEDTHSVVNSLCLGPDGWLYAAQGSTVSGTVRHYPASANEKPIASMGQAIWRYHPETHEYEIFAEGGGNAFGVAFDDVGNIYSGHNGGDTRGFHYYQGGYYRKGFSKHGSLSNPNSYGYLNPMRHDPIPRFTHTMLLTESTAMRSAMPSSMLAVDPLHGKLIQTELSPVGATFETRDRLDAVSSSDKWFRPVAIQEGPDGSAIVCDWYDSVVAHIYAFEGKLDRDRGRVYRLNVAGKPDESMTWNAKLANSDTPEALDYLTEQLTHPLRWHRWQARLLFERHSLRDSKRSQILQPLQSSKVGDTHAHSSELDALEWLWTAHACGWLQDTIPSMKSNSSRSDSGQTIRLEPLLDHTAPMVRSWVVRLACDDRQVSSSLASAICQLAKRETDPRVLCQIACSAKRLPAIDGIPILMALLDRDLPAEDPFLPLLVWWGMEHHSEEIDLISRALAQSSLWHRDVARRVVLPNLIRRWATLNSAASFQGVTSLLKQIASSPASVQAESSTLSYQAFEAAYAGRSLAGVPDTVIDALAANGQAPLSLRLRRGDKDAMVEALRLIQSKDQKEALRIQLASLVGELARDHQSAIAPEALLSVALRSDESAPVRAACISALRSWDLDETASKLITNWTNLPAELHLVAGVTLSSRLSWTNQWLEAVETSRVSASELPPEAIRNMKLYDEPKIQSGLNRFYPAFASIDLSAANALSESIAKVVLAGNGDPYHGKKIYRERCGRCHWLFDEGGKVGPDLTGYQRDQLVTLIRNIIAPSLEIREGFQMVRLATSDSMIASGFVDSESGNQIALRSVDGTLQIFDRNEIEAIQPQVLSLMPDGLLDRLSDQDVCDLMAYLRSSQPLNDGS